MLFCVVPIPKLFPNPDDNDVNRHISIYHVPLQNTDHIQIIYIWDIYYLQSILQNDGKETIVVYSADPNTIYKRAIESWRINRQWVNVSDWLDSEWIQNRSNLSICLPPRHEQTSFCTLLSFDFFISIAV